MSKNRLVVIPILVFFGILVWGFSNTNNNGARVVGCTELNGNGCVCHDLNRDNTVGVSVVGPTVLRAGETAEYRMYLWGGPSLGGGYNVAARFGAVNTPDSFSIKIGGELTQSFPIPFPQYSDSLYWRFLYTAPDTAGTDTIYSVGLSTNHDYVPDVGDKWNYGPKFPVTVIGTAVPVEFASFSANIISGGVQLNWSTATETNNAGFEVQRAVSVKAANGILNWETIGFVKGKGTTTERNSYSFNDKTALSTVGRNSTLKYRLKQTDFDGTVGYSAVAEVEYDNKTVNDFRVSQNFPNPFNPSTRIDYVLGKDASVGVEVYTSGGELVRDETLGNKSAGSYSYLLDLGAQSSSLTSGVYLVRFRFEGNSGINDYRVVKIVFAK